MTKKTEEFILRKATDSDLNSIWKIIQQAIERRRSDGSDQWQNGYPNEESIKEDIKNGVGYVYENGQNIACYAAIIFDIEPAYEIIEGKWKSSGKYAVIHRVAISVDFSGKGIATQLFLEIESLVKSQDYFVIKVDTNFDNLPMLKILEKLKYEYCGKVYFRGSERKAFEKILK